MKVPGPGFAGYGQPSLFESKVVKVFPPPPSRPRRVSARQHAAAPARRDDHAIGLHFERSHSGVPDIDPDQYRW